jgi:antitoxin VapB
MPPSFPATARANCWRKIGEGGFAGYQCSFDRHRTLPIRRLRSRRLRLRVCPHPYFVYTWRIYVRGQPLKRMSVVRKPPLGATITTVFISGNSQAVRLPKEFRLNAKTVEISRRGDEIVLRERPLTVAELLADLPVLSKEEAAEFDVFMRDAKSGLLPLEERDFSWMGKDPATTGVRRQTVKARSRSANRRTNKRT